MDAKGSHPRSEPGEAETVADRIAQFQDNLQHRKGGVSFAPRPIRRMFYDAGPLEWGAAPKGPSTSDSQTCWGE